MLLLKLILVSYGLFAPYGHPTPCNRLSSFLVMSALGEMAAYLPHRKGFAGYAARFVDPALGFALGW